MKNTLIVVFFVMIIMLLITVVQFIGLYALTKLAFTKDIGSNAGISNTMMVFAKIFIVCAWIALVLSVVNSFWMSNNLRTFGIRYM